MSNTCAKLRHLSVIGLVVGFAIASSVAPAVAQDKPPPKFKYETTKILKGVKGIEWKASAQAGFIVTTGNARTTTISAGANLSRRTKDNKFQAELTGAFSRATLFIADDVNADGFIGPSEILEESQTTAETWLGRARYDRFLTKHNSLYVVGAVGADVPAGKNLIGGGQAGYSRQIYKDKIHELKGEVGYDFTYEDLDVGPAVSIHSARVYAGYEGKLQKNTGLKIDVEGLFNFNELEMASGIVKPFHDTRVNATVALTTKLIDNISFRFQMNLRYDHAPAPRKELSIPYEAGFVPVAEKMDTRTEAVLIVNFL